MKQLLILIMILTPFFPLGCGVEKTEKTATKVEQSSTESNVMNENATTQETRTSANNQNETGASTNLGDGAIMGHPSTEKEPIPTDTSQKSDAEVEEPKQEEVNQFFWDTHKVIMAGVIILLCGAVGYLLYDRRKILKQGSNYIALPITSLDINNSSAQSTPRYNANVGKTMLKVGDFKNIGSRNEQQDSSFVASLDDETAIQEKGMLAVVADGMGGLQGGAIISRIVTQTFAKCYAQISKITDVNAFLYDSTVAAERAVEDYIRKSGVNGGSTVVAVLIQGNTLHYISVGDSHIYMLDNGNLKLINKEHSFAEFLKEKAARGEVDPSEPYVNPQRNALTAYIGMGSFQVFDRNEQPIILSPGAKILLCSDGVYNALGDDALIKELSTGDASICARNLEANILSQNIPGQDNFTGIVLEYPL